MALDPDTFIRDWVGYVVKTLLTLLIAVCTYYVTSSLEASSRMNASLLEKISQVQTQLSVTSSLLEAISKREDSMERRVGNLENLLLSRPK